jgi:hypothetical protein
VIKKAKGGAENLRRTGGGSLIRGVVLHRTYSTSLFLITGIGENCRATWPATPSAPSLSLLAKQLSFAATGPTTPTSILGRAVDGIRRSVSFACSSQPSPHGSVGFWADLTGNYAQLPGLLGHPLNKGLMVYSLWTDKNKYLKLAILCR